jgi:regulatory protein
LIQAAKLKLYPLFDKKIYENLTDYCARGERSGRDITDKLYKLKTEKEDTAGYIQKLRQENFLNDDRYAKAFVEVHARKKWGKAKIKNALSGKGISADIISKYLDDMDAGDYDELIKTLAEKKWNSIRTGMDRDKKNKVIRFLLGRGFEMGKILAVVKGLGN